MSSGSLRGKGRSARESSGRGCGRGCGAGAGAGAGAPADTLGGNLFSRHRSDTSVGGVCYVHLLGWVMRDEDMHSQVMHWLRQGLISAVLAGCVGCGSTSGDPGGGADTGVELDTGVVVDTGVLGVDTAVADTSGPPPAARRLPCLDSSGLGTDLALDQFGALEGELVSLVPPGTHGCPSDTDHLHLQLEANGKRYDVAITVDSTTGGAPLGIFTRDLPASSAPVGWSAAGFDFASAFKVSSADFVATAKAPLLTKLQNELKNVSLVSIHGRSYPDGTGLHNVHRNGGGHDGVILVRRGGAGLTDHAIALRFSTDVF